MNLRTLPVKLPQNRAPPSGTHDCIDSQSLVQKSTPLLPGISIFSTKNRQHVIEQFG